MWNDRVLEDSGSRFARLYVLADDADDIGLLLELVFEIERAGHGLTSLPEWRAVGRFEFYPRRCGDPFHLWQSCGGLSKNGSTTEDAEVQQCLVQPYHLSRIQFVVGLDHVDLAFFDFMLQDRAVGDEFLRALVHVIFDGPVPESPLCAEQAAAMELSRASRFAVGIFSPEQAALTAPQLW